VNFLQNGLFVMTNPLLL